MADVADIDCIHFLAMCEFIGDRPVPWVEMVEVKKTPGGPGPQHPPGPGVTTQTTQNNPQTVGDLTSFLDGMKG